jgi:hypothetical protein
MVTKKKLSVLSSRSETLRACFYWQLVTGNWLLLMPSSQPASEALAHRGVRALIAWLQNALEYTDREQGRYVAGLLPAERGRLPALRRPQGSGGPATAGPEYALAERVGG